MRHLAAPLLMAALGLPLAHAQVGAHDPTPVVPRFVLAGEYNFIRGNAPPNGSERFNLQGGSAQVGVTIRYWLRAVGDFSGSHSNSIGPLGQNLTLVTYMGGPQVVFHGRRVETFVQGLVGAAHGSDSYFPTSTGFTTSANSLAYKAGGGFDIGLTRHIAVRAVELNYMHAGFNNGSNNSQNHLTVGAGLVLHLHNKTWTPDPGNERHKANKAMHDMDMGVMKAAVQTAAAPPPPPPAPAPAPPPPPAPVVSEAPVSEAMFHDNVKDALFDYDSYALRPDAQQAIQEAATFLKAHPSIHVVVGGYSDERGSADYNLALGEKRASAARDALVLNGVSPDRLETISYGKERQVCEAENESCFQRNRRAGFVPK